MSNNHDIENKTNPENLDEDMFAKFIAKKLELFVKKILVKLSCDYRIEHRGYDYGRNRKNEKESLLSTNIKKYNYDFDLGIKETIEKLLEYLKLNNLLRVENFEDTEKDFEYTEENFQDFEDMEEYKLELFYKIIDFIGLYEILNLHLDYLNYTYKEFISTINE